jgi:hypothetical protein
MHLASLPDFRADVDPHGSAVSDECESLTNRQFLDRVRAAARHLDRLLHHARICQTTGESVRLTQALAGQGVSPLS